MRDFCIATCIMHLNLILHVLRLGGLSAADCYAVIVLADSATFLLAVNRIAAFRLHSAIIPMIIIRSRGSVGSTSAP